jgi:DNA-directed RNA polymerase subunit RPC12/RpoP
MDEFLAYFRKAVTDPASVPPWSEWWAANAVRVETELPLVEFVRLKHRRLLGARQILQRAGHLPDDFVPPDPLKTGSCSTCGERTTNPTAGPGGGYITCPNCGLLRMYDCKPDSPIVDRSGPE